MLFLQAEKGRVGIDFITVRKSLFSLPDIFITVKIPSGNIKVFVCTQVFQLRTFAYIQFCKLSIRAEHKFEPSTFTYI